MIQLFSKTARPLPLVMLGLLPENVRRMKAGDPVYINLRHIHEDCPDWTLSISCDGHMQPKDPTAAEKHVTINMQGDMLDRFMRGKQLDIPLTCITLVLFYTEDEDKFTADLMSSGIQIDCFNDNRGRMVN